jgi:hypothetical protein
MPVRSKFKFISPRARSAQVNRLLPATIIQANLEMARLSFNQALKRRLKSKAPLTCLTRLGLKMWLRMHLKRIRGLLISHT